MSLSYVYFLEMLRLAQSRVFLEQRQAAFKVSDKQLARLLSASKISPVTSNVEMMRSNLSEWNIYMPTTCNSSNRGENLMQTSKEKLLHDARTQVYKPEIFESFLG